ncbi:MAG: hypothetical protein C5B50_08165 [Verrucomicrobia bacterium]|nr:MAG: hypothetical protein C5B50_08165 [Verrucomicrobiota bacterium]
MFGTIRKHQTWLWAVIITLTVISFVIYFSPYTRSQRGQGTGSVNYGSISGERIKADDLYKAQREVILRYFFSPGTFGRMPDNDYIMREQYLWLFYVQQQERMGIYVSDQAAAEVERAILSNFANRGISSPTVFEEKVLKPQAGATLDDLDRFARHYLGLMQLQAAIGLAGKLITPEETKALYVRLHQELATQAVVFEASNYMDKVTVTPDMVMQFYTNQQANYRVPERVQVAYVKVPESNYLAKAEAQSTNIAEEVKTYFERNTNYTRFGKTLEEAKIGLRKEILHERAMILAKPVASAFTEAVLAITNANAAILEQSGKSNNFPTGVTAPFDSRDGPKDLEVGSDFARAAFSLSSEEPVTGPIAGKDGFYIIALKDRLHSEIPALDKIRAQVTADYKYVQAMLMARSVGRGFYDTLTNAMAQGKSFDAACTNAGFKPTSLPPFSFTTQSLPDIEDHIELNSQGGLKELAFRTPPGKVSHFQLTRDGGIILFVKGKLPINDAEVMADLPGFARAERQRREAEAFNMWLTKEVPTALRETPFMQQRQPPPNMRSAPPANRS